MDVRATRRTAFTLIEMLVVIFILAIAAAIVVPAVMQAREAARRTQCLNNLKQVALAVNAHLDQKNYYPREENAYSAFVFMLPFLEQATLFNSINVAKPRDFMFNASNVNYTAFSSKLAVFVCPADGVPDGAMGPMSYGGNLGTGSGPHGRPSNGPFASSLLDPKIRDALVRDGLANTVAVSEFCRTEGRNGPTNRRSVFRLDSYTRDQFDQMLSDCIGLDVDRRPIAPLFRGQCWGFSGLLNTSYDHNLAPNGHACSCQGTLAGVWTASSNHPNGVNCAHLDGHVDFCKDSVSVGTWRSLGTMNGGEITSVDP